MYFYPNHPVRLFAFPGAEQVCNNQILHRRRLPPKEKESCPPDILQRPPSFYQRLSYGPIFGPMSAPVYQSNPHGIDKATSLHLLKPPGKNKHMSSSEIDSLYNQQAKQNLGKWKHPPPPALESALESTRSGSARSRASSSARRRTCCLSRSSIIRAEISWKNSGGKRFGRWNPLVFFFFRQLARPPHGIA